MVSAVPDNSQLTSAPYPSGDIGLWIIGYGRIQELQKWLPTPLNLWLVLGKGTCMSYPGNVLLIVITESKGEIWVCYLKYCQTRLMLKTHLWSCYQELILSLDRCRCSKHDMDASPKPVTEVVDMYYCSILRTLVLRASLKWLVWS